MKHYINTNQSKIKHLHITTRITLHLLPKVKAFTKH